MGTEQSYQSAELLPNGLVRIDCNSGLVRLWERHPAGIQLRSGQGRPMGDEVNRVAGLLATDARIIYSS
jgi:hypothetical protein